MAPVLTLLLTLTVRERSALAEPTLLWGFDNDGGIKPLPASPALAPAMAGIGLAWLFANGLSAWQQLTARPRQLKPCPPHFPRRVYDEWVAEYDRLMLKDRELTLKNECLSWPELYRLNEVLPYPPWNNGQKWDYYE